MNIYSYFRSFLSNKNKGRFSKFLILSGLKPKVNRKADSSFEKGVVVFSADFEMAWAFRYSKTRKGEAINMGLKEREQFPQILDLFNLYHIPVTWATVGHLFLQSCERSKNDLPHAEMIRPEYFENRNWKFDSGDWYQHDPCTSLNEDPAWYAPDLIKQIKESDISHEIGIHTFSHIDFTYANCKRELAEAEIGKCIALAKEENVELKSMVFPGGTFGNFETLKKNGLICYRKPMKYHITLPYIDEYGLVAIPSSLGMDKDPYGWTKELHLKMIKKFMDKAVNYRLVCHFWFHPSMDKWYLENVMPEVLKMVADYRKADKIEVKTMMKLAEDVISNWSLRQAQDQ